MSLAPLNQTVRWRPIEGAGLEHCQIIRTAQGTAIRGTIIWSDYGLYYRLFLGVSGLLHTAFLERTDGKTLDLRSDGSGQWTDGSGTVLADLSGCLDIDIWPTPLTNSLPIWRGTWEDGAPQRFSMAWVDGDAMTVRRDDQIYTRLDPEHFRFQSAEGSFERVLKVDADGLVVEYPGLFIRVSA